MAVSTSTNFSDIAKSAAASLGYSSLKPEQVLAISSFLEGNDVFVSLPTGYGKSLCYAALPPAFDKIRDTDQHSIVIVVSPLIALMKDQVAVYSAKGMKAGCITRESSSVEKAEVVKGNLQLVYFSPESLLLGYRWRELLQTEPYASNVVAFVIDEAHCVMKW